MWNDKEIEVCKAIKEAGYKWKPGVGDWYKADGDKFPLLIGSQRRLAEIKKRIGSKTHLLTTDDCLEEFRKRKLLYQLISGVEFGGCVRYKVVVQRYEGEMLVYGGKADTPREAFLQALLKVLRKEKE